MAQQGNSRRRRGFTLTELAIVLGIGGAIIGAIWVANRSLSDNSRVYQSVQQIVQVTQNIREFFMNSQGLVFPAAASNCGDVTASLDKLNVFPNEMRRYCPSCSVAGYKIDHAFNHTDTYGSGISAGSFRVLGSSCAAASAPASRFQIVLMDLPVSACIKLLYSGINFQDQTLGITQVCAGSEDSARPCYDQSAWAAVTCSKGICDTATAMTQARAQALCASSGTSEVGWEFKLRSN